MHKAAIIAGLKVSILLTVLAIQTESQSQFKFAHISDTHIGNATAAEDLRRTVQDLNGMNDISFAIITGDITEYGSDDQLRLAKQIFDSLSIPWYIVPGNHDMKWSESGGSSFSNIFGYERFVFDALGFTFIGMHQGPRLRMGDGYWAPEDIAWFDSLMERMPDKRRPIFLATHYPADSGIANWTVMTERLKAFNTQAILNGHWHRNFSGNFEGIPSIVGRSNLRGKEPVGGYNIVTMRNDSMIYATRRPGVETKEPWTAVRLGERDFSRKINAVDHIPAKDSPNVLWKNSYGYSMTSPPALFQDYLAAGYTDGRINVLSLKTGKDIFDIKIGGGIYSSPAVDAENLVVSSADSFVYCFSLNTKKLRWKFKTNTSIVASPVIHNNIVFVGASDNAFRAIDVKSGKIVWQFDSLSGFIESKPTIAMGKVIFGAWDEHLYCLDEKNGSLLWKWKGDKRGTLLSPAACEPVYANGKIFIVAPDRYMTAIDISNGKQVWRTNQFQVRETIGLSEDGARVYIRTMVDSIYALSTTADLPEVLWGINAGFGYDINSSQIKEKDGILFYATKNGMIYAIDGKSGKVIHTFKEDVVIAHTPVPISGEKVIFSNISGTIMEISWEKKRND